MKKLKCIYFIKNEINFLPNRLIFQQESPEVKAVEEKIGEILTSEEFKKLRAEIEKSREEALKHDPKSYLLYEYIPTNEKGSNSYGAVKRPDAVISFLTSLRLSVKNGNLDEKTKKTYQELIKKLELYNDFRQSLDWILRAVVVAESILNYKKKHNEKFALVEGTLAAQAIDLMEDMRRKKDQYLPITTYTDILHPDVIQYIRDFFEKDEPELLKKAKYINDEIRKLK